MSNRYYLRLWQTVRAILFMSVLVLGVILAMLWFDKSLGFEEVVAAPAMTAFAFVLGELSRRWFNFMAGEQICNWFPRR